MSSVAPEVSTVHSSQRPRRHKDDVCPLDAPSFGVLSKKPSDSRFSGRQKQPTHARTVHFQRNVSEVVTPQVTERRSLDSLLLRPSRFAFADFRISSEKDDKLTATVPRGKSRPKSSASSYCASSARNTQASPSANTWQSDRAAPDDDSRMATQPSPQPPQLPAARLSPRRVPPRTSSASSRFPEAEMRGHSQDALHMTSAAAVRGRGAPQTEAVGTTTRFSPATTGIHNKSERTALKPLGALARTTKPRLSEMTVTDSAPQNVASSSSKPSMRQWKMLRATVKSVVTIKQEAESFKGKINMGRGRYTTGSELLRLYAIFERLSPDEDGQVPVANLSAAIARKRQPSNSTLNILKSKISVLGQTSFTFKDMLGLHYTGCTPEDISSILDSIKRHKEREEIRKLDKEFTRKAEERFESLINSDGQIAPLEMNYDTLFQCLVNEFPNAINIHNVMKTIDRDVLQRLHDGGAMTRNEFIIWHSKKLNGQVERIWVPYVNTPEITSKTAMNTHELPANHRSLKTSKRLMTPTTVLSGYLSSFYQRQQSANAAYSLFAA